MIADNPLEIIASGDDGTDGLYTHDGWFAHKSRDQGMCSANRILEG